MTALAVAPARDLLASGGLSSQAFLWDVETGLKLEQARMCLHISPLTRHLICC